MNHVVIFLSQILQNCSGQNCLGLQGKQELLLCRLKKSEENTFEMTKTVPRHLVRSPVPLLGWLLGCSSSGAGEEGLCLAPVTREGEGGLLLPGTAVLRGASGRNRRSEWWALERPGGTEGRTLT